MRLAAPYHAPTAGMCNRAATCGRCHGTAGVPHVECEHCQLEDMIARWEAKLFRLVARSAGACDVSEDTAVAQYLQMLRTPATALCAQDGGQDDARMRSSVAASGVRVQMTHQDNEHAVLLAALISLLRCAPRCSALKSCTRSSCMPELA